MKGVIKSYNLRNIYLEMLQFNDSSVTETAICFLVPDFKKIILICKSSHYLKCSQSFKMFPFIDQVHSEKICKLIINSLGGACKMNLSVDTFCRRRVN